MVGGDRRLGDQSPAETDNEEVTLGLHGIKYILFLSSPHRLCLLSVLTTIVLPRPSSF